MNIELKAIGFVKSEHKRKYHASRQAVDHSNVAIVELLERQNYETALMDLEGFEYIWLIFLFHHNNGWKPKVLPPRKPRVKRGLFATRAPYRPNPIGLSAVKLLKIEGRKLFIENHDLLDKTPILDIKPYIPYADSFPTAKFGWLETVNHESYELDIPGHVEKKLDWLDKNEILFRNEIKKVLEYDPFPHPYRRIKKYDTFYTLSFTVWSCKYIIEEKKIIIIDLYCEINSSRTKNRYYSLAEKFNEYFK